MDGCTGMEVSPSSTLCLVSPEEIHCGGENTHLCTDTHHTQSADCKTCTHCRETHVCFIWIHINQYSQNEMQVPLGGLEGISIDIRINTF